LPKPDHTNLNDYFDIGLDIAVNGKVPAARDELCKLYRDQLEAWNSAIRLPRDSRLWP
jgi:hypothetical protein